MRQLRRPNIKLPTLKERGSGGNEAKRRVHIWKRTGKVEDVNTGFPSHWGKADVRGALYAMHGHGCAYCQGTLARGDRGDVEHFRPKSLYWWLAYDFGNYFLSCSVCNSAFKGNKFPILRRSRRYGYSRRHSVNQENRALIDPVVDHVVGWMKIDFDFGKAKRKGFKIVPLVRGRDQKRCRETIRMFKLNRDTELLQDRQIVIYRTVKNIDRARAGDREAAQELRRAASHYEGHAYIVREVLAHFGEYKEYVPAPAEALEWLIEEFVALLGLAQNALAAAPDDRREKNVRDRYAWALAVLMADPPALSEQEIRNRIDNHVLPEVEKCFREL